MAEQRRQYRISNPINLLDLAQQLNRQLSSIADRFDELEGYRGTPTFVSDIDMSGNKATNAAEATADSDVATLSQIDDLEADVVIGPSSSTDNAIVRYDGTTGKLVQDSGGVITDTSELLIATVAGAATSGGTVTVQSTTHATKGAMYLQDATNGITIETDGTIVLNGTATGWEDLRVPVNAVKVPTTNPPTWTAFSAGLVLGFADQAVAGNEEQVYFVAQIPHFYKQGTSIYPHIHWTPDSNEATKVVRWGLQYEWVNINASYSSTTTIYVDAPTNSDANKHLMASWSAITGTSKNISSILVCRLFRNSSHANDTFTGSALLLDFDFHYEIDTIGSRAESSK